MAITRILVPIDFSPDSLHAVTYGGDLAKRLGAELVILHVVDQTYLAGTRELYFANPEFAKILDEQWRIANAQLDRAGADLQKHGHRCRTLMQRGVPAQVIVDTANDEGTDLIVMGTHGRTGLAHMLIGSVAERVVRSAHCPVLTLRRAARRAPRKARRSHQRLR